MKLMNFTMINIIVDKASKTVDVQKVENVPVNVEQLFLVLPEMIPSALSGPQGHTIGKLASRLVSGGGATITVDGTPKQTIKRIKDTFGVEIQMATPLTDELDEPHNNSKKDDGAGPRTLKLVVPEHIEKETKGTISEE